MYGHTISPLRKDIATPLAARLRSDAHSCCQPSRMICASRQSIPITKNHSAARKSGPRANRRTATQSIGVWVGAGGSPEVGGGAVGVSDGAVGVGRGVCEVMAVASSEGVGASVAVGAGLVRAAYCSTRAA